MAITPGTPIPIGGVNPLVQIAAQGQAQFGQGVNLASARISQNQQGLNSFLTNSLRQQMATQQQALETKRFEMGMAMKMTQMQAQQEENSLNRSFKERQLASSERIASARGAREDRKVNAEIKLKEQEFEMNAQIGLSIDEMMGGGPVAQPEPLAATSNIGRSELTGGDGVTLSHAYRAADAAEDASKQRVSEIVSTPNSQFSDWEPETLLSFQNNLNSAKWATGASKRHYVAQAQNAMRKHKMQSLMSNESAKAVEGAFQLLTPHKYTPVDKTLGRTEGLLALYNKDTSWRLTDYPSGDLKRVLSVGEDGSTGPILIDTVTALSRNLQKMMSSLDEGRAAGDMMVGTADSAAFNTYAASLKKQIADKQAVVDAHLEAVTQMNPTSVKAKEDRLKFLNATRDNAKMAWAGLHGEERERQSTLKWMEGENSKVRASNEKEGLTGDDAVMSPYRQADMDAQKKAIHTNLAAQESAREKIEEAEAAIKEISGGNELPKDVEDSISHLNPESIDADKPYYGMSAEELDAIPLDSQGKAAMKRLEKMTKDAGPKGRDREFVDEMDKTRDQVLENNAFRYQEARRGGPPVDSEGAAPEAGSTPVKSFSGDAGRSASTLPRPARAGDFASQHGLTIEKLNALNGLSLRSHDKLPTGTRIFVSGGGGDFVPKGEDLPANPKTAVQINNTFRAGL